jgi:hypothetical protein
MVGAPLAGRAATPAVSETEVKAEFVERFTHFIDWPASAFSSPTAPFVVCTTGESSFRAALEKVVARGPIQRHGGVVRQVDHPRAIDGCHILYLASSTDGQLSAWLERANRRPILSVGDTPGYGTRGTIVNLYYDAQGRVRFEVNMETARQSGLRLSAQFLGLARVIGRPS